MIKEYRAVLTIGKEGEKLDFKSEGVKQVEYKFTTGMFSARVGKKSWYTAVENMKSALGLIASVEDVFVKKNIPCHTTCYGAAGRIPVFFKYEKIQEEETLPVCPEGLLALAI